MNVAPESRFPSSNQSSLITGATHGIELAIARGLAAESCNLILTGP
jgi:short-subunit dehydrogenase